VALRTRARTERLVEERLEARGIPAFGALAPLERKWSDRVKRVRMPLFPGYVLARPEEGALVEALSVPGVAGVVRRGDGEPALVTEAEVEAVRRLVAGVEVTGALPEVVEPLQVGVEVLVVEGPFRGLQGVLLEVGGASKVVIRIGAIRQARAVTMDRGLVRLL
jgi:transcription antitermination factor NusG